MEKIKCYQVAPDETDFSYYFDDEAFTGDYSIVIDGCDRWSTKYNKDFLSDFVNAWDEYGRTDSMIISLEYISTGANFKNIKNLKTKDINDLKKLYEDSDGREDLETAAAFYSIVTGKEWKLKSFRGYVQGAYCEVLYRPDQYDEDSINEIGNIWLGCAREFIIDDVGGYYVIDDISWQGGDALRERLADISGYNKDSLEIYMFDHWSREAVYKLGA